MDNVLLLRFDDLDSLTPPSDAVGSLLDLERTGAAPPSSVGAATGRGRRFISADALGLAALDAAPGATLLTRDASIQVIASWDIAAAAVYGSPQTIYARGKGTAAAEYLGAGLELRVVDAVTRIGEVRWIWQDVGGVLRTQAGGHFQVPADGFLLLTATRRWVSSSRVVLRYYLGGVLLSEIESSDGSIGGGTTGTTSIGTRYTGAAWGRYLDGVIDELRVVSGELTAEEVAATWERITIHQPAAYKLIRDAHDPGFPMSRDPGSRVQRETRMIGDALGFAAAQAENMRNNLPPDRAYGEVLERWEAISKQAARPGDDIDTRRRRVVARFRQKRGISIPGAGDALRELLATDPANLSFIAFDQTVVDPLDTLIPARWRYEPAADFTISGGATRLQANAALLAPQSWVTSLMSIGGNGRGAIIAAKFDPTTIATDGGAGLMLADRGNWHGFAFGLRRDPTGGAIQVVRETFANGGVLGGATVLASLGAGVAPVWLQLEAQDDGNPAIGGEDVEMTVRWSTVGASGPWTEISDILVTGGRSVQWAGFYARTTANAAAVVDVKISAATVRAPYGDRAFRWYILRNLADPGSPDLLAADLIAQGLRQRHTEGHVVHTLTTLYDDTSTPYDYAPMGGI